MKMVIYNDNMNGFGPDFKRAYFSKKKKGGLPLKQTKSELRCKFFIVAQ